jgi:outer membrane protein OmpA-like peptidoglycan-associated protein
MMNSRARQQQTPAVAPAGSARSNVHSVADRMPAATQQVLNSSAAPLDTKTRAFFEPRFGHDFSGVRVHSDAEAAASARAMRANAYTVGQHIAFDTGKYQPGSREGQKLIAHELAHTVQQKDAAAGSGRLSLGEQTDQSETEAHTAAESIHQGPVAIGSRRQLSVQRQVNPSSADMPRRLDLDLAESATPFMAASIGSVTIDHFETGKTDISAPNLDSLSKTSETMLVLMKQYPGSTVRVIGHTDAVGQESDNQVLGQGRADAAQAVLLGKGIPAQALHTESHGASELLVKTKMAEPHNRRVEVRFTPGRRFRSIMSPRPGPDPGQPTPPVDLHKVDPSILAGHCAPPRRCGDEPGVPPAALKQLPNDIPYELMDVQSANEPFIAHGNSPETGGDLRATWANLYLKYRYQYHLSKELAAKAANQELSGTAGSSQSSNSPNSIDRSNQDLKNAYPDSKGVGPFNLPWKLRF